MTPAAPWPRIVAFWFISGGTIGIQYSFGLLLATLVAEGIGSRTMLAAAGGWSMAMLDGVAMASAYVVTKLGERRACLLGGVVAAVGLVASSQVTAAWQLLPSFSIATGAGHSCSLFSGVIVMHKTFHTWRGVALAVGNTGAALGPFVLVPLWTALQGSVSWRVMLAVLAAADLVGLAGSALVLSSPAPTTPEVIVHGVDAPGAPEAAVSTTAATAAKDAPRRPWTSWVLRRLAVANALLGMALWVPHVHLVQLAVDEGFAPSVAATSVLFIAAGSVLIRVPLAVAADHFSRHATFATLTAAYGAFFVALPWHSGDVAFVFTFALVSGGCAGAITSLMPTLPGDTVDGGAGVQLETAVSFALTAVGPTSAAGPMLVGALYDHLGTYAYGLWLGAACLFAASAVVLSVRGCDADRLHGG